MTSISALRFTAIAIVVLALAALAILRLTDAAHAFPGERDKLNACQAMVDRAARARPAGVPAGATRDDDADLAHCRQIIKEWTLRDSRMSVDEQGRPLR